MATPADSVVQADRVELVTASGARRAVLSADSAGVSLTAVATLGGPNVRHLVQ
ncbi:MAG: hypothetical protein ACJ8DJ_19700 [Gemmatimonadales bacterium]